jgi:hypothetical protein
MFENMRDEWRNTLLQLELPEEDVAWLHERNAYLEAALKLREQHHTVALTDNIMPRQLAKRRTPDRWWIELGQSNLRVLLNRILLYQ